MGWELFKKLNKGLKILFKSYQPTFVNIIFVLLFLVTPSDKILFIVAIFHLCAMLVVTKSVSEALVYLFWPWIVFESGREFSAVLVPLEFIKSSNYHSSVVSTFIFSPVFLLSIIITVTACRHLLLNRKLIRLPLLLLFISYLGLRMLSSLTTEHYVFFSITYVFREISVIMWLVVALHIMTEKKATIFHNLLATFAVLFGSEIIVGILQLIKGGYLGIHAERAHFLAAFGQGNDEVAGTVRISGLWNHPNALAYWLLQLLFSIALIAVELFKKIFSDKSVLLFFLLLLLISSLTLSRVAMVTLGIGCLVFTKDLVLIISKLRLFLQKHMNIFHWIILLVVAICSGLIFVRIGSRILASQYVFLSSGGITTRVDQYREGLNLFSINPIFGHGPGMFTAALHRWISEGTIEYFPERVHNAFILIAAESGLLAVFLQVLILFLLFKYQKVLNQQKLTALWFISMISFMMLHPMDSAFLSLGSVIIVLLVVYEKQKKLI